MGWISPWVLNVSESKSLRRWCSPVETEPVGSVVESDFILLEDGSKLER